MRVALGLEQLLDEAPGGIGRYATELAHHLPVQGVDVVGFTARHPRAEITGALTSFGLDSLEVHAASLPRPVLYDAWNVLGVFAPERDVGRVDVVHAPSLAVPPVRAAGLVVTVHDAAPLTMPETFTRRGRWFHERGFAAAARRADAVIAVSEFSADEIAAHSTISRERIRVVPNGVEQRRPDPDDVARTLRTFALEDQPYVFWIGTAQPRKNVRVLLDAFGGIVRDNELPHVLVLAGPRGWLVDDEAAAGALGDRVRLLGPVAAEQVSSLYAGADLFAFPSRHEGFGLPALEAMAQGTPVVCGDIPALHEVASDAARFVAPDDVDAWSDALTELLGDEQERAALSERGLAQSAGYTWDRCASETAAVYREVSSSRVS